MSSNDRANPGEAFALESAKARITTRRDLLDEIDRLEKVSLDCAAKHADLKLVTKEVGRIIEKLCNEEYELDKQSRFFSKELARANAMIIECLNRTRGSA